MREKEMKRERKKSGEGEKQKWVFRDMWLHSYVQRMRAKHTKRSDGATKRDGLSIPRKASRCRA